MWGAGVTSSGSYLHCSALISTELTDDLCIQLVWPFWSLLSLLPERESVIDLLASQAFLVAFCGWPVQLIPYLTGNSQAQITSG